jgi:nitrogenase molybdenum-cofactor synthesis protein NifE
MVTCDAFQTAKHLIYSSPATLAFNSPGAEGYGVKRAGLSIPGSVMLIVSPGCCGRNTAEITAIKGYDKRFFYLTMDETDLVTGRHLKKIPGAVKEIVDFLEEKPSVVMICLTCVDALLGTDMERIARAAEKEAGVIVRPCYMYALTREGRRPPMVHVRQSLYSLLPKRKRRGSSVNLLGFFAPYIEEFELYGMLKSAGVKKSGNRGCDTIEDFYTPWERVISICTDPEARDAARDLSDRWHPLYRAVRFYDTVRISGVLGVECASARPWIRRQP